MPTPVEAVRLPDPYPYYASLVQERPFAFDDTLGVWVAADAAAVAAVLTDPALRVRPPAEPVPAGIVGTAAGDVFGRLVRMTDGDVQQRLKRLVAATLGGADAGQIAEIAAERTRAYLRDAADPPFEQLMFAVPAQVVAALCGLDAAGSQQAAELIGEFVLCIPAGASEQAQQRAAVAAGRLQELLGDRLDAAADGLLGDLVRAAARDDWSDAAPLLANGIGFLSQTYDATAGLIGNTLMALGRGLGAGTRGPEQLAAVAREVLRYDAPVQNTRRFAAESTSHGGAQIDPGAAVLVLLAAANRDPAANPDPHEFRTDREKPEVYTFGLGAHGCPGERIAVGITAAVLGELFDAGFDPATLPGDVGYRPLANARIPVL